MANNLPGEVERLSGVPQQVSPGEQQIVDGESQVRTLSPAPLIEIGQPEKRIPPSSTGQYPPEAGELAPEEAGEGGAEEVTEPVKVALPIPRWSRYQGADQDFRELISWSIPLGYVGDLHEIALVSDNDAKTRWRIVIAGTNMNIPTDRTLATPVDWPFRDTLLPGPTTVSVEVRSTDGTTITADGTISGTLRFGFD
jgi:hypothetical protein